MEAGLEAALGARVMSAVRPCDEPWQVLYELDGETSVRTLKPNIAALAAIAEHCVIVTAGADKFDFVSRMFAPHYDVPEDPVTGSAHCLLAPFWSDRLAKQHLLAHQSSARGGTLWCERQRRSHLPVGSRDDLRQRRSYCVTIAEVSVAGLIIAAATVIPCRVHLDRRLNQAPALSLKRQSRRAAPCS